MAFPHASANGAPPETPSTAKSPIPSRSATSPASRGRVREPPVRSERRRPVTGPVDRHHTRINAIALNRRLEESQLLTVGRETVAVQQRRRISPTELRNPDQAPITQSQRRLGHPGAGPLTALVAVVHFATPSLPWTPAPAASTPPDSQSAQSPPARHKRESPAFTVTPRTPPRREPSGLLRSRRERQHSAAEGPQSATPERSFSPIDRLEHDDRSLDGATVVRMPRLRVRWPATVARVAGVRRRWRAGHALAEAARAGAG